MKFISTNGKSESVSAKDALVRGLAPDGGLYVPAEYPKLDESSFTNFKNLSFAEVSTQIASKFFAEDVPASDLERVVHAAVDFDAPLVTLEENLSVLELFHGPTLAFKDFGARFMARALSYFRRGSDKALTILVATSGDTGSAVAHGFHNVPGIDVVVLYPSGKVSELQEKQLTTMGGNISALEVQGTFDDCQKLVKEAFVDEDLKSKLELSSANSINIGRLVPQMFYYVWAAVQSDTDDLLFSVPSGNFGNLTAGLYAKKVYLPQAKFIAATNINDIVPKFLETGEYEPKPSKQTISNAMDVGNPSNFARIMHLYNDSREAFAQVALGASYDDEQTRAAIKEVYEKYEYLLDPHGAVGFAAARDLVSADVRKIIVETAHPAKFKESVDQVVGFDTPIPERLAAYLEREKDASLLSTSYEEFKAFLLTPKK